MQSFCKADAWDQFFTSEAKEELASFTKIYQHPPTLNTKIPGNFRITTDCLSPTKIILQKTEEIWQNFG